MNDAIVIVKERKLWRVPAVRVYADCVERARRFLSLPKIKQISVAFVGDATMRQLNTAYRGKTKTTDVLSFCYRKTKKLLEGDIVISVPQARRQARAIDHTLSEEIRFLFVHGFLHLLGYDHERSRKEERIMFALQKRILGRE
ncbi:rRNA maturation RNase YbeY [Candidatus Uhrbacteria bacterium]|nr:rRNA maturation RNase YbeY [Candidatus Uhrbacteria bacterium]